MKIAYIKPSFPNEKRVGLLPKDLPYCSTEDERRFEQGYGENLGIPIGRMEKLAVIPEKVSLLGQM